MSKQITLTDEEVVFFQDFTLAQRNHAQTDPARGVLTIAALDRILAKLEDHRIDLDNLPG